MGICMNDKTLFSSRNESRLVSKLITLVGFALGDTYRLWFAKAVKFIFGVSLLCKESLALF